MQDKIMQDKVKDVLKDLTLEEKAQFCAGADFWHLFSCGRLGIPQVMVSDGPHGLRKQNQQADNLGFNASITAVCFPAACATAASFDENLLETMGEALGEECRAEEISILLGPGVNIKRSPLCGRNFEYFSEDPYLTGKLAAAQIRGVQKWDVGTSIKHFAANNQEYQRQTCSSEIDERTFREIYLRGFEIAIKKAKPWTVMCSYNKINGTYASENKMLLTRILREDWGFDGCVMSDWGAVNDRVAGILAGLDLEMPASGGLTTRQIIDDVHNGTLPAEVLDKTVERILNIIFRYADSKITKPVFDHKAHHLLAAEIEKECAVLLKNDGVLPLDGNESVAFIGEFAKSPRYQGGGSSHINASYVSSAYDEAKAQNKKVVYAKGFSATQDIFDETLFAEAVQLAGQVEKVVIFAGLPELFESEGYDREHMRLPACQNELISRIAAVQKNIAIILHNGSPVELPWADDVNAVLEMYLGGQGVGEAAVSLLYGDTNPSGRLPETFPLKLSDNPSYLNFPGEKRKVRYAEGIFVGYRYYDAKQMEVRFPFGHGLSYTQFEYGVPSVTKNSFGENEKITLSVTVKNTGNYFGKEVVQLYIRDNTAAVSHHGKERSGSQKITLQLEKEVIQLDIQNNTSTVSRPDKELRGFKKIALHPGESKRVDFDIDAEALSYYDVDLRGWYAGTGTYDLIIARSSRELAGSVTVQYTAATQPYFHIDEHTTFGELLSDARTRPFLQSQIPALIASSSEMISDAFPLEALLKMAVNVPISFLRSILKLTPEQFEKIIALLRSRL